MRALHIHAKRIVRADLEQRQQVEHDQPDNDKRQQEVNDEKALNRHIGHAITAEQPGAHILANKGNDGEEIGNHLRPTNRHVRVHNGIAHKGCAHHQHIDDEADPPHKLSRRFVRAIIEPAQNMEINHDEEEAGPHHVDFLHDVIAWHIILAFADRPIGIARIQRHGQKDACDNHNHQHHTR